MKSKSILLLALTASAAFGGSPAIQDNVITTETPAPRSYWLNVLPYGWVTDTDGDMGIANRVVPVDISFEDTLSDLDLAFMLSIEGGINRWVFGVDGLYGAFSSSASLPPATAPFTRASVDFDQFFARGHIGYRLIDTEEGTLTAFAGARYSYVSMEISLSGTGAPTLSVDGSKSWIDPVIGLNGSWKINDRWFVQAGGDVGGFGVNSDLIWQANAALGYHFTESISGLLGYRGLGVDYSDGGFLVDTVAHGPAIGVIFRF
jgi:hypothetical protein